jgi:hypothetical protein
MSAAKYLQASKAQRSKIFELKLHLNSCKLVKSTAARFFLVQHIKTGKKLTNEHEI